MIEKSSNRRSSAWCNAPLHVAVTDPAIPPGLAAPSAAFYAPGDGGSSARTTAATNTTMTDAARDLVDTAGQGGTILRSRCTVSERIKPDSTLLWPLTTYS
jgi:hypothetical protein